MMNETPPVRRIASSVQHQLLNYVSVLESLLEPLHTFLHPTASDTLAPADDTELFTPDEVFHDLARTVAHLGVLVRTQRLLLMENEPTTAIRSQMVSVPMQLTYARQLVLASVAEQDIVLVQHPMPDLRVQGNSVYLMTAFAAALMNAIEGVRGAGHGAQRQIDIHARQQHDIAYIRIEDTGTGFRQDILEQIITALAEGPAHDLLGLTTKARPGVGIGLMAQVAQLHGGRLTVGNYAEQAGAWVEFALPLE